MLMDSKEFMKSPYSVAAMTFVFVFFSYKYYQKNHKSSDSETDKAKDRDKEATDALKISSLAAICAFLVLYVRTTSSEPILTEDFTS
jgi:fucose permease